MIRPALARLPDRSAIATLAALATLAASLGGCTSLARQSVELDEGSLETGAVIDDRGRFPFQGEQMSYVVEHTGFKAKLLELSISVGFENVADDGTAYIPITGWAESISIARMLAQVEDTGESYIDPRTWQPLYAVKDLDENGKERSYYVWFWPDEMTATVEKHKDGNVSNRVVPLPGGTVDAVSWVYHLRTMDLDKGSQASWFVYDGWVINRMTAVVGDPEDVWTPLGYYNARKIDIYREKLDSHWPQGALSGAYVDPELTVTRERYFFGNAWISDDEDRIPVRMAVETKIGDLDLKLQTWTPPAPPSFDGTFALQR